MRIAVATMVWGRPHIFKMWINCIKRLQNKFDIVPVAAVSEKWALELCKKEGINCLEIENKPLGRKANERLLFCRQFDPDYVLLLGSDDIISTSLLEAYMPFMEKGVDVLAVMDLYYYDTETGDMVYTAGYKNHRKGEPLAPARCVSKRVLNELGWKLWNDYSKSGIDTHSRDRLKRYKHTLFTIKNKHLVLDIKSPESLSPFRTRRNYENIDTEYLFKHLPEREAKVIIGVKAKDHYRENSHPQEKLSPTNKKLYDYIDKLNPRTIFEFGCNCGRHLKKLRKYKCSGIDINKEMILKAKKNGLKVKVGDETTLSTITKKDLAFTNSVICHMPPKEAERAVKELKRIGKCVILVETRERDFNYWWPHDYKKWGFTRAFKQKSEIGLLYEAWIYTKTSTTPSTSK